MDVTFLEDSDDIDVEAPTPEPDLESAPPLGIISLSHLLAPARFAAPPACNDILKRRDAAAGMKLLEMDIDDAGLDDAFLDDKLIEAKLAELQMPPLYGDDVDKSFVLRVLNRSRILKRYLGPTTLQRQMNGVRRRVSSAVESSPAAETGNATKMGDGRNPRPWTPSDGDDDPKLPPRSGDLDSFGNQLDDDFDEDEMTPVDDDAFGDGGSGRQTSSSKRSRRRSSNVAVAGALADAVTSVMQVAPSKLATVLEPKEMDAGAILALNAASLASPDGDIAPVSMSIAQKQRDKAAARTTTSSVVAEMDEVDLTSPTPASPRRRTDVKKRAKPPGSSTADSGVESSVEAMYEAALRAERAREWRQATLLACACINMDKEFVEAIFLRARLCRRLGLWSQALKDLTSALRICPSNHRLHLQRAHIHIQLQDYHAAINDLTSVLSQHPTSAEALLLRSQIYMKQNNLAFAIKDLTTIVKFDPKNWRAYYERGRLRHQLMEGLVHEKDVDTEGQIVSPQLMLHVLDDYLSALRAGCTLPEVVEAVGDVCLRLVAASRDAKPLLHTIHALSGLVTLIDDADARTNLRARGAKLRDGPVGLLAVLLAQRGRLQTLIGEHAKAATDLDRAVVLDYHYAPAHFYRGALASLYAHDEAARKVVETHLSRSVSLDPTIIGAYIVRGGIFALDLRYASALQDFKAAVSIDPTLDSIWVQMGVIFLSHYHDCAACVSVCTTALANDRGLTQALYLRAESYARQGHSDAALRDYVRLVQTNPADGFAHLLRGKLLLQLGHGRPALYAYMAFMELSERGVDRISRGIAYSVLSQHAKAVHEFKLAVEDHPSSENLYLLSEALHSMGDTEAALEVIERAIATEPQCARNYLRRAQCYLGRGALKSAIIEYDFAQTLTEKAELPRVLYERAMCRMQLLIKCWHQLECLHAKMPVESKMESNFKSGTPVPETLAQVDMTVPALSSYIKTLYNETLADFAKCLKLSAPTPMVDALVDRAELHALGGDFSAAYADLRAALDAQPENVRAYINWGILDSRLARRASSIVQYDLALQHHPADALAYYNRGVAYHHLCVHAQAETDYTKAIALDPTNLDAVRNRGIARCHLSDFAGATTDFEQVHRGAPDDLELYLGLGYVYLKTGRFQDAIGLFRASASVNPRGLDAFLDAGNTFLTMALFLSETSNPLNALHSSNAKTDTFRSLLHQALHCYQRAVRLDPTSVDCRLNLAALFRALRDVPNAVRQYAMVQGLDPHNHVFHEENAIMLSEAGQYDDAILHWNDAIRLTISTNNIIEMEYTIIANTPHMERRPSHSDVVDDPDGNYLLERLLAQKAETVKAMVQSRWRAIESPAAATSITGLKKKLALQITERGKAYERLGLLDKARLEYLYASYFDPLAYAVYFQMGTLALRQRRSADAVRRFDQAIALHPKLGLAHLNLAMAHLQTKNVAAAKTALDIAASLMPECGFVWANLACAHLQLGNDRQGAVDRLSSALKCMPTFAPFYVARGRVLTKLKLLHDAMVDFAAALQMGYKAPM
ncbi:hypothetical protein SPRG_04592 [Saprolegnia parasitica CBS 223.65]|uniref:TPR-like protein n=1 Tax=Saprolegnia parasitica (strain CBS 223.65) TaxID=695850 RepID=A0A067CNA9_SAPPC|nr:hypothetical protein SPRG_04592 [Saprolegnia parasitica CBS 223.65]KDO30690.1 hypothetical protein SPRG_04592 [Saprolegnia parasitica CBS 223.65]|eukprot:XP_012198394.1 hypothetical protein SPRG_04592 [Saprolegnia parasitica CBS 223.65]